MAAAVRARADAGRAADRLEVVFDLLVFDVAISFSLARWRAVGGRKDTIATRDRLGRIRHALRRQSIAGLATGMPWNGGAEMARRLGANDSAARCRGSPDPFRARHG
ncbi:hypothetical protein B1991_13745 [Rhodanobacter lindaniclasticus]|uniref:Uncharacterized protein n=1 Tax=Rhodanobacter lindaniclasticus TaxID=75310 RepID=A0A4S3KCU8_9GAMM|nr:hypothetical protein B1991_13745 [Rhodanobacter lindaniclasticus]